ncbi:MAG: MerR family transcriptional regulator [Eubacteriales bacterium]|nr:MerR family transcriptional regulator [Eubacteriales bacterium]
MTSKEMEQTLGISRANIRFYEKEGLLIPKRNPVNSYREYSEEDVEALKKILFLRNLDFSIEEIRSLQMGKTDLAALLAKQRAILKERMTECARAEAVCRQMEENNERDYAGLQIERYEKNTEIRKSLALRDRFSFLKATPEKLLGGVLILVQLLLLAFHWRENPQMLIYPFLSAVCLFGMPAVIWNLICSGFPFLLGRVELVSAYASVGMILVLLTGQIEELLEMRGMDWNGDDAVIIEIIVILILAVLHDRKRNRKWEEKSV